MSKNNRTIFKEENLLVRKKDKALRLPSSRWQWVSECPWPAGGSLPHEGWGRAFDEHALHLKDKNTPPDEKERQLLADRAWTPSNFGGPHSSLSTQVFHHHSIWDGRGSSADGKTLDPKAWARPVNSYSQTIPTSGCKGKGVKAILKEAGSQYCCRRYVSYSWWRYSAWRLFALSIYLYS